MISFVFSSWIINEFEKHWDQFANNTSQQIPLWFFCTEVKLRPDIGCRGALELPLGLLWKVSLEYWAGCWLSMGRTTFVEYSGHDLISAFRFRNFSSNSILFKHGKQDATLSALMVVFSACVGWLTLVSLGTGREDRLFYFWSIFAKNSLGYLLGRLSGLGHMPLERNTRNP